MRGLLLTLGLTASGLTLLAVLWAWSPRSEAAHEAVQLSARPAKPAEPAASAAEASAAIAPPARASERRAPSAFQRDFSTWLQNHSALRGTELDGGWGSTDHGELLPSLALRRRFDYLLQLQGQRSLQDISAYLRELAEQDLSPANVDLVMAVWQRYLQLQQIRFSQVLKPQDPARLGPALAEQQQARRRILGPAWAQAFYGEDEGRAEALIQALSQPAAVAPASTTELIDRSQLDASALVRLQQEDAAQAHWQARLSAAQTEIRALQRAPQLSEPQRRQAMQDLIDQRFEGSERQRARALLSPGASP